MPRTPKNRYSRLRTRPYPPTARLRLRHKRSFPNAVLASGGAGENIVNDSDDDRLRMQELRAHTTQDIDFALNHIHQLAHAHQHNPEALQRAVKMLNLAVWRYVAAHLG